MTSALERIWRSLQPSPTVSGRAVTALSVLEGDEEVGALPVRDGGELNRLVSEVLSEARSWPVVGLTARFLEDRPALDPAAVRAIVGAEVPIYLICWRTTRRLEARLPRDLHVFGGAARIWRPLSDRSPELHPLVFDATGEYGAAALEDLARKLPAAGSSLPPESGERTDRRVGPEIASARPSWGAGR